MQKLYTDPDKDRYPFWFTKAAADLNAKEASPLSETHLPTFSYHDGSFFPDFCCVKHG